MPRLQEREYEKNGVMYAQYRITISQKKIDELRWKGNDEIDLDINDGKLICENLSKSDKNIK